MENQKIEIIEVVVNDRIGKKLRIKCSPQDTIFNLKQLISGHTGTKPEKLKIQKGYSVLKDPITLDDYEIKNGSGLELYYN